MTGDFNLTSYYAKRIIGDTAAASQSSALLQTGTNIATDTWILHRTNRASLYGIKYKYDSSTNGTADKIELYGGYQESSNDIPTVWAQLDTGDTYILGKVGIGINPDEAYKLYVNGSTYFNGNTTHNGIDYFANDTTYYIDNSAVAYFNDLRSDNVRLVDNWIGFYQNADAGGNRYGYIQADINRMYFRKENGVNTYHFDFGGHIYTNSNIYTPSGSMYVGTDADTTAERQMQVRSGAGTIYMYSQATTGGNRGIYVPAHGTGAAKAVITVDTNNGINFYGYLNGNISGSSTSCTGNAATATTATSLAGGLTTNDVTSHGNLKVTTAKGSYYGINFGGNASGMTIMSINASHQGLYNQTNGQWILYYNAASNSKSIVIGDATVHVTGGISLNKNTKVTGTLTVTSTITGNLTGNAVAAGGFSVGYNNAILKDPGVSGVHATVGLKTSNGAWTMGARNTSSASWIDCLIFTYATTAQLSSTATDSVPYVRFTKTGVVQHSGNDYAENRLCKKVEPGRVVIESGNDTMELCNARLVSGARIVSDTYGSVIGPFEENSLPIAVSGRALVYPYKNRNEYKSGDAVCSAPNGTVDIMTRDEIMLYPERIIGIVSSVPEYDTWYTSECKVNPIPVNGRIWIYVR